MGFGYSLGRYYISMQFSSQTEKQALWLGIIFLITYGLMRGFNIYGDSGKFENYNSTLLTVMSFFNPTKYPLSLQFMLLTVGAGLILLFCFKQFKTSFSRDFLQLLGKTSMFSYILHLYLLHLISWILIPVLGYKFSEMTYSDTLIGLPEGYGLTYGQTYLFALVVILLTALLANYYLVWKKQNKTNVIARYI